MLSAILVAVSIHTSSLWVQGHLSPLAQSLPKDLLPSGLDSEILVHSLPIQMSHPSSFPSGPSLCCVRFGVSLLYRDPPVVPQIFDTLVPTPVSFSCLVSFGRVRSGTRTSSLERGPVPLCHKGSLTEPVYVGSSSSDVPHTGPGEDGRGTRTRGARTVDKRTTIMRSGSLRRGS